MINALLNNVSDWYVRRGLRPYHVYPASKTAVVFVNVQEAFVEPSSVLAGKLASLAELARRKQFLVIHAPMSAALSVAFPTPAHLEISRLLSASRDGSGIAPSVGPHPADIVLPARSTLSAYGTPAMDSLIEARGLDHLILAGPLANWTIDSSLRDAVQRDCHATILRDCLDAVSEQALQLEIRYTMPRYAQLVTDLDGFRKLAGA